MPLLAAVGLVMDSDSINVQAYQMVDMLDWKHVAFAEGENQAARSNRGSPGTRARRVQTNQGPRSFHARGANAVPLPE